MLPAWARGTDWNLFPLCSSTACKLNFAESKNATPVDCIGVHKPLQQSKHWPTTIRRRGNTQKNIYNRANIITKYQMVFLREKFFEFGLVIAKETCFSILVEKIPPF
jgi:hypothetical protein